jgi:uncharacterized membrane protein
MPKHSLFWTAALAAVAGAAPARADYFFTDLGVLPGQSSSVATAISPDGAYIAGISGGHAWVWTGGVLGDLGGVPTGSGGFVIVPSVNDSGQVIVTEFNGTGTGSAVRFAHGGAQDLDFLGANVVLGGINDSGQIIGSVGNRGFVWTPGSGAQYLPSLPNGVGPVIADAINNAGQVAGREQVSVPVLGGENRPFIWSASAGMTQIPLVPNAFEAQATAISQNGRVAGTSGSLTGGSPFEWDQAVGVGGPSFGLGAVVSVGGVNSFGQVVGTDEGSSGIASDKAFVWNVASSSATALNNLTSVTGWDLVSANAIDDAGQIVGEAISSTGQFHAYLLSPPGSIPGNPLRPTSGPGCCAFSFTTAAGTVTYVDPPVATRYDFVLGASSPLIGTAVFPTLAGDPDGYNVFSLTDPLHPLFTHVLGGVTIDFTTLPGLAGGIDGFEVRGIDRAAGLDPMNPLAFETGLSFVTGGAVSLTQYPISGVPEAGSWAMLIIGAGLLGSLARRRRMAQAAA